MLLGPIISIDDDSDDQFLIKSMINELLPAHQILFFQNGLQAHEYLLVTQDKPFLILCDINMPVMTGLELRNIIDADPYLKKKAIPFIFLTTSDYRSFIIEAYEGTIQGYFKKEGNYEEAKKSLELIIKYWQCCRHPNNF